MAKNDFEKLKIETEADAVVAGLAYAGLFGGCLSEERARELAIGRVVDLEVVVKAGDGRIVVRNGVWGLVDQEDLLEGYEEGRRLQQEKLAVLERWSWVMRLVPWVKMVAVTGSVAGGNPTEEDDIDLLVVTAAKRLWLSRMALTLALSVLGKRRKPGDDPRRVRNAFCLNMWVSEEALTEERQDLYVANELARMIPVVERDGMYERYVGANGWVERVLPNFGRVTGTSTSIKTGGWRVLDWLDEGCRKILLGAMRERTNETVKAEVLKFHPVDHGEEILRRFGERAAELGLVED